jgi:hypothetical protein
MSKNNGLGKLYERLTPEERFRLDVEAMARGDTEESRKLTDTCPRRTYTMNDIGFAGRWDGAVQLTMAMLMDLRQVTARLRVIDAFKGVLPLSRNLAENDAILAYLDGHRAGTRYAWARAGMEGEAPGLETDEEEAEENADEAMDAGLDEACSRVEESSGMVPRLLDRLEREIASEAIVVWAAYLRFCEETVQVEAEKLLMATFKPALEDIRWLESLVERLGLEAEAAAVEEYREGLVAGWRKNVTGSLRG